MNKGSFYSRLLLTVLFLFSNINLNSMDVSLVDVKNTIESYLIKNKIYLNQEKEFLIWEQIVYFGSKIKTNKNKFHSTNFANEKFINSEKAIDFIIIVIEEELEKKLSIENIKLIKKLIYGNDYVNSGEFSDIEDSLTEQYDEYEQPFSPKTKRSTRGEYKDYPGTPRSRKKDKNFSYKRRCKTLKNKRKW
jgi:hypothetical protein